MSRPASVRGRRSVSRRLDHYRPQLVILEERLPLGDGVLGLLVGASLLSSHAAPAVITPAPASGERGVLTPRYEPVTGGFTAPARHEAAQAFVIAEIHDAATDESPLTHPFTPTVRRRHDTILTSPQRQQGSDVTPLLAPRAREMSVPAPARALPPLFAAPTHADIALLATLVGIRPTEAPTRALTPAQEAQVRESFGKLPLSFEENVGQTDASVHFFTRGPGYGLYLTSTEAVMVLKSPKAVDIVGQDSNPVHSRRQDWNPVPQAAEAPPAVVRMQLVGANATPAVTGHDEQPGKVNYFLGNDPAKWHTNVATFARVEYDDVYPGIDLVWHGSPRQLEYDFVAAPGADPTAIRLRFAHADRIELDAAGDLVLHTGGQELRQHAPVVYQDVGGQRQEVASRFVLEGQQVRFDVAAYDAGRPLVIDPVLSYSTYLGGSYTELGNALAVDPASGDALLTGHTQSTNFPTANPLQASNQGSEDVFVTRLNASGSALVFSTYLGGSGYDSGSDLAVDPASGDTLVTGHTYSTDFPTANPLQAVNRGGFDVFVTRLNAGGSALVFSTYLGGSLGEYGTALAVDPATGDALLTGETYSTNFPTANPLQPSCAETFCHDAFVTRLSAAGSALVFSTYLGGSDGDGGTALAVDPASGDALVTGYTESRNFPPANPLYARNTGGLDVFVTRLNAAGSALVFSTYLGGSNEDGGRALAVDPASGDALVAGYTQSPNFPTANPLQASNRGGADGFVARLNAAGSALVFSTYLGGSSHDIGLAVVVDPASGDALVTGYTWSTNFPTANPLQPVLGGGAYDAFVTRIGSSPVAYYYVYPDSGQVQAGVPFDLYVFALDAQFHVIPDYTGLILFWATDPLATTPVYHYFQRPNPGYAYFPGGLTFNTVGMQELYVFDWPGVQVFGYAAFDVRP